MESNPKPITVLMAVYDEQPEFLKKSIESILCQTFSDFEFLIINDGSTNKSCFELLEKYAKRDSRIKIIKNKQNLGLTKSLNRGLSTAGGTFIARIDSDDIAQPNRLEKQLAFMKENPSCALCGSWTYIIDEKDDIIGEKKFYTTYEMIRKKILFFNFFTHSSLFFRRNIILEENGYDEKIKKAQDYDLVLRTCAKHEVRNIPEFLCKLRENPHGISSKGKKKQEWYGLVARWKAISQYGFPKIWFWKIIPAVFYFLFVPYFLEKIIFKFLWRRNV